MRPSPEMTDREADQQASQREQQERRRTGPIIDLESMKRSQEEVRSRETSRERREQTRSKTAKPGRDDDRGGKRRQWESLDEDRMKEVRNGSGNPGHDDCHSVATRGRATSETVTGSSKHSVHPLRRQARHAVKIIRPGSARASAELATP